MSRDILKRLSEPALIALCIPGGDWPRALLSNTLIPDAWMGLVERRDGRRRLAVAGEDPRPAEDDMLLLIRNRLITVPLDVRDRPARCDNRVDATCELLLKWAAHDDDLASLRRSVLFQSSTRAQASGLELSLDRLADVVAESGARSALEKFVRENDAARLVGEDVRSAFLEALRAQLARFLFEIGATLEQVAKLHFTSASLAQHEALQRDAAHRVERIETRELVEQAALAATHKRLGELTGVLDKLKSAAPGNDRRQWHELLPSLTPAERGRLLENMWRISPDKRTTTAIVVVAGGEVVFLDAHAPERVHRRVHLPDDLGPLRSVAFDAAPANVAAAGATDRPCNRLLVGAATGVWALCAEDGTVQARFEVAAATAPTDLQKLQRKRDDVPRTGFNSAAVVGGRLYATHSQLGCWSWSLASPAGSGSSMGEPVLLPADGVPKTIRALAAASDGRVLFAADDCVHAYSPESGALATLAAADDTIHALAVLDENLYAGTADGKLLRLDLRQPDDWWVPFRTNLPIESVQARRWNDLVELVVPAGSQGVVGIYAEENVITRLMESSTPIRRAWASDDLVVGLSDRRDRLVVLHSSGAERIGREAPVARILGSSVQDACLVLAPESGSPEM